MSTRARPAHRIEWYHGHPLGHVDLSDWAAYEPELLGLHVRAGHGTRGVADGLWVARTADLRAVVVSRGSGFTCRGRVLHLGADQATTPPGQGAGRFLLVLRPAPEAERECRPAPPCPDLPWGRRAGPATELAWRDVPTAPARGRCGPTDDELPLARISRGPDGTLDPPDLAVRRVVTPATRPRIAHGVITGDALDWYVPGPATLAAVVAVDTGFDIRPDYFVSIHGVAPPVAGTLGPWPYVGWSSSGAFELRLGFAAASGTQAEELTGRLLPALPQATIAWIAVERPGACGTSLAAGIGLLPAVSLRHGTFLTGSTGGGS